MSWRNGLLAAMVLAGAALGMPVEAQTEATPAATARPFPPATLAIFNRPVFTFRHSLLGLPPAERAVIAREHIYELLELGGDDKVSVETLNQGRIIKIGSRAAFVIADEDVADPGPGATDAAAVAAAAALTRAIEETREARDGSLMGRAIIHSAIATAVFLLVLWLLIAIGRRITFWAVRLVNQTSKRVRIGGAAVVHRRRAIEFTHSALRLAGFALILLAAYEWLGYVLGRFPYTRVWSEHLHTFLFGTVADIVVAVARSIPELFVAVLIFIIARGGDRLQRRFFYGVQAGRADVTWVDKDTAPATRRLVTLAIWLFAAVMAYPYIPGSSTDAFKGLSVLLGLMVSVGASGIVGQAASGLILMYTRTFRPGDYVRVGDAEGTVEAMGVFTTRVRTGMGDEITIPNATVLGGTTRNYSRGGQGSGFMLEVNVTIGYDAPWRQVRALLLDAVRNTDGIELEPAPRVLLTTLSDFYVAYRLVCHARPAAAEQRADVMSALHAAILDSFNEHGVQIMSPHYYMDPAAPKVVPKGQWHAAPAAPPSEA